MVFMGVQSALFFSIVIGTALSFFSAKTVLEFILAAILWSFFLSWAIVFSSFFLGIGDIMLILMCVFAGGLLIAKPLLKSFQLQFPDYREIALVALTFISLVVALLNLETFYPSFRFTDAIFAYNRWAQELSGNYFKPFNLSYPVLLPGIMSLIYKAQGDTSIWFFAKGVFYFVPLLVFLSCAIMFERKHYMAGLSLVIIVLFYFFVVIHAALFNGQMDAPVAMMVFCFSVLYFLSASAIHRQMENIQSTLLLAALAGGLAAVTKQAGFICIILFSFLSLYCLTKKLITARKFALLSAINLFPIISFYILFLSVQPDPFGDLARLSNLSTGRLMAAGGYFERIMELVGSFSLLVGVVFLGLCSLLNLFYIRRTIGLFGTLLLFSFSLSCIAYLQCCAYEARNGWWLISLLIMSAIFGTLPIMTKLEQIYGARFNSIISRLISRKMSGRPSNISSYKMVVGLLSGSILFSAAAHGIIPQDQVNIFHDEQRWFVGWKAANKVLRDALLEHHSDRKFISSYRYSKVLPVIGNNLVYCPQRRRGSEQAVFACYKNQLEAYPGSFVFLGPKKFGSPEFESLIPETFLIGQKGEFRLYGPLTSESLKLGN